MSRNDLANIAENPALDLLATRSFSRLAATLRERRDAIMGRWEEMVRNMLPQADELTLGELRDSLPEIIDQMVNALASDQPPATIKLVGLTGRHGAERFHQNYNARELVAEYRMFRRVLVEEIWRNQVGDVSEQEITVLNMAIDTAVEGGVMAFLEEQKRQIRAACEAESKYLSFLSHDLRNHLNHATLALQLHTQNLRRIAGCDEAVADVEMVQRSIHETMQGMERLLQAERLRKGNVQPKSEPVDLHGVAAHAAGQFVYEAKSKSLELLVEVPKGATAQSDAGLIAIVLQNLIGNAIKYSSKGKVTVSADSRDGMWVVSVSDNGPGISKQDADRLFNLFTRGETHGQDGVGLGLSIAAQAAKVLGGNVTLQSKPGEGSTFSLVIPAANAGAVSHSSV
jgi:signal transduction histidine kinase